MARVDSAERQSASTSPFESRDLPATGKRVPHMESPMRSLRLASTPFALLLGLCLTLAPGLAHAVTQVITASVAANTSWGLPGSGSTVEADVFWVQNSINVNSGVTLTIRQGVVVKFNSCVYLNVLGSLQTTGTALSNVTFTSIKDDNSGGDTNGDGGATLPNPSDWQSVYVTTTAPDTTRFLYTQIKFAGCGNHGAVTFTNTSGRMTNCTIQRSYYGVDCAGTGSPLLVDTIIQTSTFTPIVLDLTSTPVFTTSTLVISGGNNGYDAFGLRGGSLTTSVTLPKRGATFDVTPLPNVTYVLLSAVTINVGGSMTISPGVVIKPLGGQSFNVSGTLTMNGTSVDTITVTSISDDNFGFPRDTNNNGSITAPNRGDWGAITYNQGAIGSMQYCRLKFGSNSASTGMVDITNMNLPVSNTLLSDAGHGIAIHGTAAPVLNTVAINNCSSTPTLQSVSSTPTYTSVTFLANAYTALGLIGEAIGVDSQLNQRTLAGYANITYLVLNGYITMNSPAKLTIDPGVVIKFFGSGTGIVVNGALDASGTGPNPVTFTSYRDDLYGNPPDTNGDGSITTPATGDWGYIQFTDASNDLTCKVLNDRLLYGSYYCCAGVGVIWCVNSSPTITGNTISKSNYGIRCEGNSAPVISGNTIQNCTAAPIIMSVQSDPTISGNTFLTNGTNGLALIAETLSQNAVLKYRPTVTFPVPNQTVVFAYVPTGTITVPSGVTLSIQPQVVIKPQSSFSLFDVSGALNVVGSTVPANRVFITSYLDDALAGDTNANGSANSPTVGNWGGITFNDTAVDATCLLRNLLFQFGSTVINTVSASPKLAALEFFQNTTAVQFGGNSKAICDSLTILNCTNLPIIQSLISDPSFAHMTLANNAYTAIGLIGETIGQDVRTYPRVLGSGILNNMAYIPTGTITIGFGAKWTIAPGVTIKMGRIFSEPFGAYIQIDGALIADGKPDSLIVFTSSADDAFGGDTRQDGASTLPAPQQWYYITFTAVSNAAATIIDQCRFRYGGYSGSPAIRCLSTNISITNSTFYQCYAGVSAEGNAAPTFTNVNIDTCTVPVRMSLVSNPTFTNVNFIANTYTALGVISETIAQDLLWKIRPVSGRQNMPYLLDGTLGVGLGSTLTLQPGLIVKLQSGSFDVNRAFIAEGRTDPDSLIIFTSYRDDFYGGKSYSGSGASTPSFGDWNYITIQGTAIDANCRFRNCVMRYGSSGSTQGVIRAVNSSPSIDSCLIAYNGCGVSVEGASDPSIHGCSLYGNQYFAVNNTGGSFCTNATGNYWGAANGPNDASATADLCLLGTNAGSGDVVSNNVNYTGFTSTGLLNPLLGDVSLNGQVRAYDASLVLQYLVPSLSLSALQKLVANVDNSGPPGIDNTDASLILQYVAGVIPVLPGNQTRVRPSGGAGIAYDAVRRMEGTFTLRAGEPRRVGETWEVPILASGTAPIFGAEVELSGANAATLESIRVPGEVMEAHGTPDGTAKLAMASAYPIAEGEIATFVFPAGAGGAWEAPTLTWARVNRELIQIGGPPPPAAPGSAFFAAPRPNPANAPVGLQLGISQREDGARATLRVLDLAGRLVRTVHDGPLPAGVHSFTWDLRDASGGIAAPGVYLVRAQAGAFRTVRRLIVVR